MRKPPGWALFLGGLLLWVVTTGAIAADRPSEGEDSDAARAVPSETVPERPSSNCLRSCLESEEGDLFECEQSCVLVAHR